MVRLFDHLGEKDRTFTVTAVAVGPGQVSPSGAFAVSPGGKVTFTLTAESGLLAFHETTCGYRVGNHVLLGPAVTQMPYPSQQAWQPWEYTPTYRLENVRSDHTLDGVFYHIMVLA